MADVRTYDVGGSFINDLGKTVLPASIKPFDFSALDKAMEVESEIGNKAVEVAMQNVKDMGRIKDELTQLTSPSLYHAAELEAAKKAVGLDEKAFAQAANSIYDPMAMFEVDRKMKKLSADPRVKNLMFDNAVLEATKMQLPTITDPGMRAIAIKDINDATQSQDPNAIKNLNLSQYQSVDLETAYLKALDQFAPYIPTQEQVVGDDGTTYTRTVNKRDPEMVAKTRKYFQDNKVVKNNLMSKGYVDDKGNAVAPKGGMSWFDDIEAPQLVPLESISNVKGASGKSGSSDGAFSYTPSPDLAPIQYTPDVYTDEDTGNEFDLGVISDVETGGRAKDNVVHVDPSGNALNVGGYSFNGGTGANFLDYVKKNATTPAAMDILNELDKIPLTGGTLAQLEAKAKKARPLYQQLEKELGGTMLHDLERKYAVEEFGNKAVDFLHSQDGLEDYPLTKGDSTLLMDTAIQWGTKSWQGWIKEFAKQDDPNVSLQEFITNKRMRLASKLYPNLAQSMNDRAYKVWDAATRIDGGGQETEGEGARGAPVQQQTGSFIVSPSDYGKYIDPGVTTAVDSLSTGVPDYYAKMEAQK